jgi:error-prone DNA polymerase
MFITIEDEMGVANVVVWSKVYEKQCSIVLGASMMGIKGYIQREGEVVQVVG